MNPIILILLNLIYRPIFNLIVILLAVFWWNLWLAIIVLTLIVRLLLLGPSIHANNMQKNMVDIQPRLKELQEQYKDDPQKLWEETMKLFKQSGGWNIMKGCLMMLVQIPVFLWLFYVIRDLAENKVNILNIYSFLYPNFHTVVENINHYFLWIDLFAKGWTTGLILAIIAGILMYSQMKLTTLTRPNTPSVPQMPWMPKMPDMTKMMEFMNIFMVVMMMTFVYAMPAWIGLYIVTTTAFTVVQFLVQYREILKAKYLIWKGKSK